MTVTTDTPAVTNPGVGFGQKAKQRTTSTKGPADLAKGRKTNSNPAPVQPNKPTIASVRGIAREILDSIRASDPSNSSDFIRKSLGAMLALRQLDASTMPSTGGAGSIASAAIGAGMSGASSVLSATTDAVDLASAGEQLGLATVLNALNRIMPEVESMVDSDTLTMLNEALSALITDANVGPLATSVTGNTAPASSVSSSDSNPMASTGQSIGGNPLDPGMYAYALSTAAVGTTITRVLSINGASVTLTAQVTDSYLSDSYSSLPTYTGTESSTTAAVQAQTVTEQLVSMIRDVTLTAQSFVDLIQTTQQNAADSGLQSALGTGASGILSSLSQLVPLFASNIEDSLVDHAAKGRLQTMEKTLQNHAKILAIAKKKLDIADIFSSLQSAVAGIENQAQAVVSRIQSALSSSGLGAALQEAGMDSGIQVTEALASAISSGSSVLSGLPVQAVQGLLSSGQPLIGVLNSSQVAFLLQSMPPASAMALLGSGATALADSTPVEIEALLSSLSSSDAASLYGGSDIVTSYAVAGSSDAELASNTAVALAVRASVSPINTVLTVVLPVGLVVTATRTA